MKKIISSLLVLAMFSNVAEAQIAKNTSVASNKNIVDDIDDIDDVIKPSITTYQDVKNISDSKEAKMFLKQDKIPDNIKQDFKEKDGYLLEGFQLGVGASILGGANAQLGYRIPQRNYNFWKNRFGFRLDYNSWDVIKDKVDSYFEDNPIEVDGNDFYGTLKGTNYGLLVDFYPFGNTWALGNFRLSLGYYTGDFSIGGRLVKLNDEHFNINGFDYLVHGTVVLDAMLKSDVKGPYAGVGFDFALLFGFKFYFDAGLVFTKKPEITTNIVGSATLDIKHGNTNIANNVDIMDPNGPYYDRIENLLEDTKKEYEDELSVITDTNIFPMIKLGVMLRF